VLLKYLGERGDEAPFSRAAAVCVPFALDRCADRLEHGFSRFYQWWLVRDLKRSVTAQLLGQTGDGEGAPIDLEAMTATRTFREFDDLVTAPLHGFRNAAHYYAECSSRSFLRRITTPTLIVQAEDDPFMFPDVIPGEGELGPGVQLEIASAGGHVGFVDGHVPWRARYWLERRLPDFLLEQPGSREGRLNARAAPHAAR